MIMNPETTLAAIIASDKAGDDVGTLMLLGRLTPNQVADLEAFDTNSDLVPILWGYAPHWAYAVVYASEARLAPKDRYLKPEQWPPADQMHHDRPLSECTNYTDHYYQWTAAQVELQQLAREFREQLPIDLVEEIKRCDEAIENLLEIVDDENRDMVIGRVSDWRNRRADLVEAQMAEVQP
jgi:hypothetical protein